jgi:hypothetical protein
MVVLFKDVVAGILGVLVAQDIVEVRLSVSDVASWNHVVFSPYISTISFSVVFILRWLTWVSILRFNVVSIWGSVVEINNWPVDQSFLTVMVIVLVPASIGFRLVGSHVTVFVKINISVVSIVINGSLI